MYTDYDQFDKIFNEVMVQIEKLAVDEFSKLNIEISPTDGEFIFTKKMDFYFASLYEQVITLSAKLLCVLSYTKQDAKEFGVLKNIDNSLMDLLLLIKDREIALKAGAH